MPLFFIVSGFFFNADKVTSGIKKYVLKKAKNLLLPYIVVATLSYIVWLFLKHDRPLLEPIYNILWLNQSGIPIATAIWFLTCLFVTEIIFAVICKATKASKIYTLLTCVILSILAYVAVLLWNVELPWSTIPAIMALPLYWFGWFLSGLNLDVQKKILNNSWISTIILFIVSFGTIQLNSAVNMRVNSYGNYFLFYINAILVTIVLWNVSNKLKTGNKAVMSCMTYIGRNSLIYLCLNQATITLSEITIGNILDTSEWPFKLFTFLIVIIADTIIALLYGYMKKIRSERLKVHGYKNNGINS